jgi:acetyl-CoA carboxylase biotin carboxyl carrier protein
VNAETTSSALPSEQKASAAIDRQPPPEQTARPTDKAVNVVKAPSAGVFHRAPDPAAAPFVEIGTEVKVGQSLCVIEAMKVFNTIPATQSGRIIKIAASDGQDVDFGQPLFEIG